MANNKVNNIKKNTAAQAKPKKKVSVLMYIVIGFTIGALILAFYFGVIDTAAKRGIVKAVTEKSEITLLSHTVKEVTGGNETVMPFWEIDEVPKDIPEIIFEDKLYLSYEGKTREDFAFFMYYKDESTGKFRAVYENIPNFNHPKDENGDIIPGEYIVKLKFSWGSNDKNYITDENFFKIIYK